MARSPMLVATAAAAMLASCTAPPATHYYLISASTDVRTRPLAATVAIQRFDVAHAYADAPIAYRTSPVELNYYQYHRWAPRETSCTRCGSMNPNRLGGATRPLSRRR